ncbi:hypothetical protein KKC_14095, partial [Listeria fleischmannii subsp. coloradonensis]
GKPPSSTMLQTGWYREIFVPVATISRLIFFEGGKIK